METTIQDLVGLGTWLGTDLREADLCEVGTLGDSMKPDTILEMCKAQTNTDQGTPVHSRYSEIVTKLESYRETGRGEQGSQPGITW